MISSNPNQQVTPPPTTSSYNFGPKSRLKGFHKSHKLNVKQTFENSERKLPSSSSNQVEKQIVNHDDDYGCDEGGGDGNQGDVNNRRAVQSSFGTSFMLSNDYLTGVDGSIGVSVYGDNRHYASYSRLRNLELDDYSVLFHTACKEGNLNVVIKMLDMNEYLLNSRIENVTPLYTSIQGNEYGVFSELLKRKADIRSGYHGIKRNEVTRISCLYLAIYNGNYKMVEDLLQRTIPEDINMGKRVADDSTEFKETPLFLAIRLGDVEMVKILTKDERFWKCFDILKGMVSVKYDDTIVNTLFQALFSIEGKNFLEWEKRSRACFLEIKKLHFAIGHLIPVKDIESAELIHPLSALHLGRCFSGRSLKTIHSPLYLAIMNENDYLTRELLKCVPNTSFGELVITPSGIQFESCLYLAIYKRSIHVIIGLIRVFADKMEDLSELKEFAFAEGIDLDHCIKVARHFNNQMYKLSKGIDNSYHDLDIIASDIHLF